MELIVCKWEIFRILNYFSLESFYASFKNSCLFTYYF